MTYRDDIAARLRHYTLDEAIALFGDFLAELDDRQQVRLLELVTRGPRPLVAEALGLDDGEDLLGRIKTLHDDIANDVYVQDGVGCDPEYHAHRGFGDDSWIDELDDLFAAADSLFRAGHFAVAVEAFRALFAIFHLGEDGFHFTCPNPAGALRSDLDTVKEHLFVAIGRSNPDAAGAAIEVSDETRYDGSRRHALLDAWAGRSDLMAALEAALIERASQPLSQGRHALLLSHPSELLREFYRRYRTTTDYALLCRQVGPQQGWPYEDLVQRERAQENWPEVLAWTEEGLAKLPAESRYRAILREARGQALMHLGRPAEAVETLLALLRQQRTASVYLAMRDGARAIGRWTILFPQVSTQLREDVLAETRKPSYSVGALLAAGLLGFAYLLEGDWRTAVAWAADPRVPAGWGDGDLLRTVATGLVRMGLAAARHMPDEVLSHELGSAPVIIREHTDLLDATAHPLPAGELLDGAVQLYERLVERAADGKSRATYQMAGAFCRVIRSVRRLQRRESDFKQYYQELFITYRRYPALKDELRQAIEGSRTRRPS
jgi:tetratricopeptide (TPR) repeat protein